MSAIHNNQEVWTTVPCGQHKSKYEKCLNITGEIYKRINITFEIKKLETNTQSDFSDYGDEIDSNDLSNGTDLFACDKSDISSTEPEVTAKLPTCEKFINNNNNEEKIKQKRPKKRFRKRVKKRQPHSKLSDTEYSSDEAVPLSRIVDIEAKCKSGEEMSKSDSPDVVMGVPKIVIITKDMKPKIKTPERKVERPKKYAVLKNDKAEVKETPADKNLTPIYKAATDNSDGFDTLAKSDRKNLEVVSCSMCTSTFRGEKGLRRHMSITHLILDETKRATKTEHKASKPA